MSAAEPRDVTALSDDELNRAVVTASAPAVSVEEQEEQLRTWDPVDLLVPEWRYLLKDPLGARHEDEAVRSEPERAALRLARGRRALRRGGAAHLHHATEPRGLLARGRLPLLRDGVGDLLRTSQPVSGPAVPRRSARQRYRAAEGVTLPLR